MYLPLLSVMRQSKNQYEQQMLVENDIATSNDYSVVSVLLLVVVSSEVVSELDGVVELWLVAELEL